MQINQICERACQDLAKDGVPMQFLDKKIKKKFVGIGEKSLNIGDRIK